MRRLIRAEEVANALGISRLRVYQLARVGELPSVRLGTKSIRFDPEAVEAWVGTQAKAKTKRSPARELRDDR